MFRKAIFVVFAGVFLTISAQAGVVPGRWEKVQAEKPGTEMIIALVSGEQIRAVYQEVGADSLLVTVDGSPRTIPKPEVAAITTAQRRSDSLINGALIGAGIGLAIGLMGMRDEDLNAAIVPLAAGVWTGIGLGVDAAVRTKTTLYKAPGVK
ncbi:MAG: hypothetical protein EHM61_04365 [Acidobacteria bacterium]|nr:MAG: hypothetical protein EHM61_04365 [Acidobacteriota bacterium]